MYVCIYVCMYIYIYINQISHRSTKGWLQEMGSNEEQPLRRFAVWLGGSLRSALSAVVPVKAFRRRHKSLEDDETRGIFSEFTKNMWII